MLRTVSLDVIVSLTLRYSGLDVPLKPPPGGHLCDLYR